jgi:alpha-beta hydrolase superfamily lysophospholipase
MSMTLRRRLIRILLIFLLFPPILAGIAGWLVAPSFLHPIRRELTPDLIREADASFAYSGGHREDFNVRAPDGAMLRGWIVRPEHPNGNWVLLFHGVGDNRMGVISHSEFLLRSGYSVVMMDARAHGVSGGPIATYGWLERNDTKSIIDALLRSESFTSLTSSASSTSFTSSPHVFALGESMGAGIALQSAAVDPRIEAVVAEGKTLFRPFSWMLIYHAERLTGLPVAEVSPEKAVASRAFPVLLICDEKDEALPCRHTLRIYAAAIGSKQFWEVPGAFHTGAIGFEPAEFARRVLAFFANVANAGHVQ